MIPDAITLDRHIKLNRVRIVAGLSLLVLLIVVIVEAAYVKGRPITQTGGQIDQGYLWGGVTVDNNNNIVQHLLLDETR